MAFDADPDYDLLAFMSMAAEDPEGAKGAFGAFWSRHQPFLIQEGARYASRLGGLDGVGDLVYDTLLRAWKKAGTFKPGGPGQSPEKQSVHVRRWLVRIMSRLFLDANRASPSQSQPISLGDWDPESPSEVEPTTPTEEMLLMREIINELPEREQTILWKTIECFDHSTGKPAISSEELRSLANSLGTTIENIRQIRKRTYQAVRSRMKERLATSARDQAVEQGGLA